MKIKNFLINNIASKSPQKIRDSIYEMTKFARGGVSIRRDCYFQSVKTIHFGTNVFINKGCRFYNGYGNEKSAVHIKSNVTIGFENIFITTTHEIGPDNYRANFKRFIEKPIVIEEGTWITSNCTILPGVTIGKGCIIAAGAVVTKNCEDNGLYGGIPAVRIKDL